MSAATHLHLVREEESPAYDAGETPKKSAPPRIPFRQVPDAVLALKNPYASHLWGIMLYLGKRNRTITASWNDLARLSGMNRKTVQKTLAFLIDEKFITVEHSGTSGRKQTDRITLHKNVFVVHETDRAMVHDTDHCGPSDGPVGPPRGPLNRYVLNDTSNGYVVGDEPDAPSEKPMPTKTKGSRIAEDTVLSPEWIDAANKIGIVHDVQWQFDAFMDNHIAKGSTFVDWRRAWQTWCRKAISFNSRGPVTTVAPARNEVADAIAERERLQSGNWKDSYERRTYGLDEVVRNRRLAELDRIIQGAAA